MLNVKSSEQSRQLFQVQHTLLKEIRHLRRVKHQLMGQDGSPDSVTQQVSEKVTPRDNAGTAGDPAAGPAGPSDGGIERQKTEIRGPLRVNLPLNLSNTMFEKKIQQVVKDLNQLTSSFTHIQTSLKDAENSASVYGWDERSVRKAKLIMDKLGEQNEAYQTARTALADAILRARGKNPPLRQSPRQSPRINTPAGAPPSLGKS
jgi:hypothetical protein